MDIGDDTNVRIDQSGIHILKKGSNAGDSDDGVDNSDNRADHAKTTPGLPAAPAAPAPPAISGPTRAPATSDATPASAAATSTPGSAIIDQNGIRITLPAIQPGSHNASGPGGIHIALPPDVAQEVSDAIDEVATDKANEQMANYQEQSSEWFMNFVLLLLLALFGTKVLMGGKKRAEAQARAASADAEHANLQRQVSEAKMQMMQAQVEPHFLFNTLASVEHLIETDPPRASAMQKRLIQYLRAVLPQMRETALVTNLGREADIVRAYLDLLKMRMEERLVVDFQVPDGLRSAAFPPMMLQSLVENAIKHGLECKAEGGTLKVMAEVAHNKLRVSVTDDGLGFGAVPSDSTGLGLQSIRDRLKLLHGAQAQLIITPNTPSGVCATIEVPYQLAN
ncbi:sensor histidine kinase [Undibacterium arcticum]|uniref:sensor histidine kinase n=1 Tax=Undibacterium arcticum TaxID=1762892 RepID=UPI00361D13B5